MINNLKSIKAVIAKIVQNLDIRDTIPEDDFIEWISDAYRFIGSSQQLHLKEELVCVCNYKGKFACDFYKLEEIYDYCGFNKDYDYVYEFNQFFQPYRPYTEKIYRYNYLINNNLLTPLDYTNEYIKQFRVENNHVITSFEKGILRLKYLAYPIDNEGYMLVADDESYDMAFMWYVAKFLAIQGKLKVAVMDFNYCNQQWLKYCLQARGNANLPDKFIADKIGFTYTKQQSYQR